MNFGTLAPLYFERDLIVVPVKPGEKSPKIPDWNSIDFDDQRYFKQYGDWGIALKPGASGIIALDIDIIDEGAKKEIEAIMPPIYCGRLGDPRKLPTVFYKYSDEVKEHSGIYKVEIIINSRICVLPPTNHPKFPGTKFRWVNERTLLNCDLDMLPDFNHEFYKQLMIIAEKYAPEEERKSGGASAGSRHDKLVSMCKAKIGEGIDFAAIVDQLIEYDESHYKNTPKGSYFNDKTEGHKGTGRLAAFNMVGSCMKTVQKKGGNIERVPDIQINFNEFKDKERLAYPKFQGIMQDMFDYVYKNSLIPRSRLTIPSIETVMSMALGGKVIIDRTYPNSYLLMVAPTGFGKDFPLCFPKELLVESDQYELLGEENIISDTSVLNSLTGKSGPVRLDTIDEADSLFGAMSGANSQSYQSRIETEYNKLYSHTSKFYKGKFLAYRGNKYIGQCHSPYICILAATTPTAFKDSFTRSMLEKGLGRRFNFFIDIESKERPMTSAQKPIPVEFIKFMKMWRGVSSTDFKDNKVKLSLDDRIMPPQKPQQAQRSPGAMDTWIDIFNDIESRQRNLDPNSIESILLANAALTIEQRALRFACSNQYDTCRNIMIGKNAYEWSYDFFNVYYEEAVEFLSLNISSNIHEKTSNGILEKIKMAKSEGITKQDLLRKTRDLKTQTRNQVLSDLEEAGLICSRKTTCKNGGRPITRYHFTNN